MYKNVIMASHGIKTDNRLRQRGFYVETRNEMAMLVRGAPQRVQHRSAVAFSNGVCDILDN
jgi:hypothetical protein